MTDSQVVPAGFHGGGGFHGDRGGRGWHPWGWSPWGWGQLR